MSALLDRARTTLQRADRLPYRWPEKALIAALVVVLCALSPLGDRLLDDGTHEHVGVVGTVGALGIGLCLLAWREHPGWTLTIAGALVLALAAADVQPPFLATVFLTALAFVAGERFSGRTAWVVAGAALLWGQGVYLLTGEDNPAFAIFTIPGYVAGVALRLRRQTAEQLAVRARELEEERELFAALSVRNERARIAAELHDVIGHALSVVVVQSAAGQRLVGRDPEATDAALAAIADSARQGRADLRRLLDLLDGEQVAAPDLSLIDELVARAAASGLAVTCRFEGDRDGVPSHLSAAAFRVVQESLTNALRHAPGAAVRVLVRGTGRSLEVQVENDPPTEDPTGITGTGGGLLGLRERVRELGGRLDAGPTPAGGWRVGATLPQA